MVSNVHVNTKQKVVVQKFKCDFKKGLLAPNEHPGQNVYNEYRRKGESF